MTVVRILADDLTGALDTAAEFVPLAGDVPVIWAGDGGVGSVAFDSGTRELAPDVAADRVGRLVPLLSGAGIAFKKIDSLMRGPVLAELAACMRVWRYCVLAPAFPHHGRVTRGGRQYLKGEAVGGDLVEGLQALGVEARLGAFGPGVTVFDAETDEDLAGIVAGFGEPVLWAGTGGLAQAFCEGLEQPALGALPSPVLGLFGTYQTVTLRQLAACPPHWMEVDRFSARLVPGRLAATGMVLVTFRLPCDTLRAVAAQRIAEMVFDIAGSVEVPGTVVVAGGETLRSVCAAVGAERLVVRGRLVPGVARSVIVGGRWNGVTVVSKSGSFGHAGLLRELLLEGVGS